MSRDTQTGGSTVGSLDSICVGGRESWVPGAAQGDWTLFCSHLCSHRVALRSCVGSPADTFGSLCFFPSPPVLFPEFPLFTAARMRIPAGDLSSSCSCLMAVAVGVEIWRRIPSDGKGTQGHLSWVPSEICTYPAWLGWPTLRL